MILLVALSQSSYSSSSDGQKINDRTCDQMHDDTPPPTSVSLLNNNSFVGSVLSSDNNASSFISHQQPSVKLEQSCMAEPVLEMDSEDSYSDNSSIHSDGSSSFDASPALPLMNESVSLNERRRAILDLSISKIQTMNASNVAVSLRKSLLIYKTMKSLQRDLDAYDVFVCDSLTERENVVIDNDMEMLETNEFEEGNWKQSISDFNCNINSDNSPCNQHLDYDWPWGTLVNTSEDAMQGSEKCDNDNLFNLTNSNDLFSAGNIWSSSDSTDSSAFVDDYLGMLCAWEDENYNPLTNCNLTRAEIMNMFHLPSYHLNNQLVSQA
uniref:SERTA domain-containing protein n=1 Tax=Elaeophora elaphi TaxID=1147741 RepID=A0A0R3RQD9_9BILA